MGFNWTIFIVLGISFLCTSALIFGVFLYYYNRFSRLRTQIEESMGNIDLYLGKQNALLQSVADTLEAGDIELPAQLKAALEAGERAQEAGNIPGKAGQMHLSAREAASTSQRLRQHGGQHAHLRHQLDQMDTNATDLEGAQRYYNALVREHNLLVTRLPSAIVAMFLSFKKMPFLQ